MWSSAGQHVEAETTPGQSQSGVRRRQETGGPHVWEEQQENTGEEQQEQQPG